MGRSSLSLLTPRMVDSLAITAISGYQRYLSPYKGFRCAHRVLHRGESCSQYVKRMVREEGLGVALQKSRVRFAECKEANYIIHDRRRRRMSLEAGALAAENDVPETPDVEDGAQNPSPQRRGRKFSSNNQNPCQSNECDNFCDCSNFCVNIDVPDCSGCDPTALDCNGCGDVGSCDGCGDVGSCGDCGSCSN
jgi:putative component of membrane protein insertase Oxa1/YidC/SpoIIIJ protein YidD